MYEEKLNEYKANLNSGNDKHFRAKHYLSMHALITQLENPTMLELGVQSGNSTKLFLNALQDSDQGSLVSVDIDDCTSDADSPKWTFIRSDLADTQGILEQAPKLKEGIDVLFIDSLHTVDHVYKEIYGFFPYLKKGGVIFIDDIDSAPYAEGEEMDSFYVETENRQILNFINRIFEANMDRLDLSIHRGWTGLARLDKRSDFMTRLNEPKGLKVRQSKRLWKLKRSLKKRKII